MEKTLAYKDNLTVFEPSAATGRWRNARQLMAFAHRDAKSGGKFTDFSLMSGSAASAPIRVHKVVLACQGLKIRQMLESTDSECLVFADLDRDCLQLLVDAMYTGNDCTYSNIFYTGRLRL